MIDLEYPDDNFDNWCAQDDEGIARLLTVGTSQFVILRWDLGTFAGKNLITISRPVLQRMIDGKTVGLALRHLGAVVASFYTMEDKTENVCPGLHFNLDSD